MSELDIVELFEGEPAEEADESGEVRMDSGPDAGMTEKEAAAASEQKPAMGVPPEIMEVLAQNSRAMQAQAIDTQRAYRLLERMIPQQEPQMPEEDARAMQILNPYIAPLREENSKLSAQVRQLMEERNAAKEQTFRDAQVNAISTVRAKFPDFDSAVVWGYMEQDVQQMVRMGLSPEQAESIVLKTHGSNPAAIERIWKAHIYSGGQVGAAKQNPDEHISANAAAFKKSTREALTGKDRAAKSRALLTLFGDLK